MNSEKRAIIDDLAVNFRNAMDIDIDKDKFDIEKTVLNIGGRVDYFDDNFCEEEVVKTEDDGFIIRIDKNRAEDRHRFSIARELGHLFMHMQYGDDEWNRIEPGKYKRPPGMATVLEEEANEFSAAFLMPAKRFIEVAKETSDDKFYYPIKIAEYFDTYKDAVIFRGKSLGLWE